MSEYIVMFGYEPNAGNSSEIPIGEQIVRCRDCKHFCEDRRDTSIGWVDVFVCVSEQWSTSSLMPNHKVEPDGFCAWGEKRR